LQSLVNRLSVNADARAALLDAVSDAIDLSSYRTWLLHDEWSHWVHIHGYAAQHWKTRMRRKGAGYEWQQQDFTIEAVKTKAADCKAVSDRIWPLLDQLTPIKKDGDQPG